MPKTVAVNDAGLRIGEGHHCAVLTDSEVDLMREMHENDGLSYKELAEKFEVSKWCVGKICRYERRAQTPADWKRIKE